ncbi:GAF domain-containing sensor histidine kinase [Pengzhenrongella phosphoraccumulans]|uniref:GAF domain-containing sensor histidine kinase n=1 Tax=Pengzhenrongella phosphoraccumulans TaxID=3114394 RepID=UPI00388D0A8E
MEPSTPQLFPVTESAATESAATESAATESAATESAATESAAGPGPLADGRLRPLMDAIVSVSSELDIATVLERLVTAACGLTGARYGAMGVLDGEGGAISGALREFVSVGVDPPTERAIGALPKGRGLLGHLIDVPRALRLPDLTAHPAFVGFPAHHPPMRSFLGLPVRASSGVYANLYLTDKLGPDGEVVDFTRADEEIVMAVATAAGVAIDHARTYRLARQHERWLEAAAACTSALTGDLPLAQAAEEVLSRVRDAAGAVGGGLNTHAADLPDGAGAALRGTRPVMFPVADGAEASVTGGAWLLAIPLRSGDRWVGGLLLGWPRDTGQTSPPVELAMVAGFADKIALALDVEAAQADRARLAVLEERERIARDLHDMVIQRLFAIGLSVQATAQDAVSDDVAHRLDSAVDELDETIKDIRATIFRLGARPSSDGFGFRHQIDGEVVHARAHLGFLPRLRTDGVTAVVPRDIGEDAVAVVREALANTARHARARSAIVRVSVGEELVLEIQDDGIGLPDGATRRSGLANLEARATRLGGSLRLDPAPLGGTVLTWRVPLGVGEPAAPAE